MGEKQWIGMALAILGALFWGLSGTSVQYLEGAKHLNVEWLLEARLLVAGGLTIILAYMQDGECRAARNGIPKNWFVPAHGGACVLPHQTPEFQLFMTCNHLLKNAKDPESWIYKK